MSNKTGYEFAKYAASKLGCAYGYGVQGVVLTEELLQRKIRQYPKQFTPDYIARTRKYSLGRESYDCTTAADLFTGKDHSANGWLQAAQTAGGRTKKQNEGITWGPIKTIPESPGIAVHYNNHMGTYIGDGEVVEARGVNYGVVLTRLKDRGWQYWTMIPGISYEPVYPVPTRNLRYRRYLILRGNDVKWLQQSLTRLGFECGPVDGSFGPLTLEGVKMYQRSRDLEVDGICGPLTRASLLKDLKAA